MAVKCLVHTKTLASGEWATSHLFYELLNGDDFLIMSEMSETVELLITKKKVCFSLLHIICKMPASQKIGNIGVLWHCS